MKRHMIIPDTQVTPDTPTDHLRWIGQAIVDYKPDVIIHLGDHADMKALSSYDKGKKAFEGRRVKHDIDAANRAMSLLMEPLHKYNRKRRLWKEKLYRPELHFCLGNHEHRINRCVNDMPELDGMISTTDLNYAEHGWQVHPFLQPITIDGITYAHFFANPMNGRPMGGQIESRIKNIGFSFTMGHQQCYMSGELTRANGTVHQGLVSGACYLHDAGYKGYQGNAHFRGIIIKNEVRHGNYDPMRLSLDYLCRKYEGVHVWEFMKTNYPDIFERSTWMRLQEQLEAA